MNDIITSGMDKAQTKIVLEWCKHLAPTVAWWHCTHCKKPIPNSETDKIMYDNYGLLVCGKCGVFELLLL